METAGACFERCLGQAPAEVLMLWQLEAATGVIVAQSQAELAAFAFPMPPSSWGHGFKPQFKVASQGSKLIELSNAIQQGRHTCQCTFLTTAAIF
jgi:hypothetical protein